MNLPPWEIAAIVTLEGVLERGKPGFDDAYKEWLMAESPVNWADKAAERVEAARRALEERNKTEPQRRIVLVKWVDAFDGEVVETVGFVEGETEFGFFLAFHRSPAELDWIERIYIGNPQIIEIAECAVGFGNKLSR